METSTSVRQKMKYAIDYLISIQRDDGSWHDYCLPIGESDQWVTAFTALGVAQASKKLHYRKGVDCAFEAAKFLKKFQGYKSGWGFNRSVGVDADSTAHAIRLFRELRIDVEQKDEESLMEHYTGYGAFRTYCRGSEWGGAHPDVTAAAGLALNDHSMDRIKKDLLRYCGEVRLANGSWPTYWWRNHQYGTYYMLELHERLGEAVDLDPCKMDITIQSCFDLAWSLGLLWFSNKNILKCERALQILWKEQGVSGVWPGSPSLRVTNPDCKEPWIYAKGDYYKDMNGTITTSSVLRVLSRWL
jgi:hypothetical protein